MEKETIKTLHWNKIIELTVGQKMFVGHCGSGHYVHGELATFVGFSPRFLYFVSDSGQKFKTKRESLSCFSSKRQYGDNVFVSPRIDREFIHSPLFDYTTLNK